MIQSQCQNLQSKTAQQNNTIIQMLSKIPKKRKQLIWTNQQNQVYVQFLKCQREFFRNEKTRRKQKIFIKLSQLMQKRTAEQCRSHHQRMMISHKSISKITKYLETNSPKYKDIVQIKPMPKIPINPVYQSNNGREISPLNQQQDPVEKQSIQNQTLGQSELWKLINVDFWLGK